MRTGRNKHDIRVFCPPTLALISTCELERCPATHVVAGLDSSKRSSTNNLSLGSRPAGRALPATPAPPGYAGSGLQCFFSTTSLTQDYCFVNSFACVFHSQGLNVYQIQLVTTCFLNSDTPTSPGTTAEASRRRVMSCLWECSPLKWSRWNTTVQCLFLKGHAYLQKHGTVEGRVQTSFLGLPISVKVKSAHTPRHLSAMALLLCPFPLTMDTLHLSQTYLHGGACW